MLKTCNIKKLQEAIKEHLIDDFTFELIRPEYYIVCLLCPRCGNPFNKKNHYRIKKRGSDIIDIISIYKNVDFIIVDRGGNLYIYIKK